jgi:hypothetical protein
MKVLAAAFTIFTLSAQAADCLSYSENISLEGVLSQQTFAGPPNYESIATGDRKETYLFITRVTSSKIAELSSSQEISVDRLLWVAKRPLDAMAANRSTAVIGKMTGNSR